MNILKKPLFGRRMLAMSVPLITWAAVSSTAMAADDWQVDGEHGEIRIQGLLSEGACLLDMRSAFQQVELGPISTSQLIRPGASGQPTTFQINLHQCARSGGEQRDRYSGMLIHDAIQPVVTISFTGEADPLMPALLKISGTQGIGLKLTDPLGRSIIPGERGLPQLITPGDNVLTYSVAPVRTPAPLIAGEYRAVANFEVSYE